MTTADKLQPGEIYAVAVATLPPGCPGTNSRFALLPIGRTPLNIIDWRY